MSQPTPSSGGSRSSFPDPLIGRTLGGSYVVQELIGTGGMANVYRAEQLALRRKVAVKVLRSSARQDPRILERFLVEARAASRLNHPNSVAVIDFGTIEEGVQYLVMEYLDGASLAVVRDEEGPLPLARIARIAAQVLGALGEAHSLGITHRDLKPENIILVRQRDGMESAKVVDFGIARLAAPGEPTSNAPAMTLMGSFCGTPEYVAPEQAQGLQVDGRADLYSLGIVLFELLAGELPYSGETVPEIVQKHMWEPVCDPRQRAPDRGTPDAVAEVVMRAMQKQVTARFPSAEAMADALRAAVASSAQPAGPEVACPECGAKTVGASSFCGQCGARIASGEATRGRRALAETVAPPPRPRPTAIGRLDEIRTTRAPAFVLLSCPPGSHRTELIETFATEAAQRGDTVVRVGPHRSRARVAYHAIRSALTAILGEEALLELAARPGDRFEPLQRAGLAEIVDPRGLRGPEGGSRAAAVADALGRALASIPRDPDKAVLLLVDDADRLDPLSLETLVHLSKSPPAGWVLVVAAAAPELPADRLPGAHVIAVEPPDETYAPVLGDLGSTGIRRSHRPSVSLLERLPDQARRAVQAAAVLGEQASLDALGRLLGGRPEGAIDRAVEDGVVTVTDGRVRFPDAITADVIEASIPAEPRRTLHDRALAWHTEQRSPIEVRAEHAYRGSDAVTALLLLDQAASRAARLGDAGTATLMYNRAVEVARRESLLHGDELLQRAVIDFTAKLAGTLLGQGELVQAEGLVREALAGASGVPRARLLTVLGRAAGARHRRRDAYHAYKEALLALEANGSSPAELAEVRVGLAELHERESRRDEALDLLKRADEDLSSANDAVARRAVVAIQRARVLIEAGDLPAARATLEHALSLAEGAGVPAVAADALSAMAGVDAKQGQAGEASRRYAQASERAAEAGDLLAWRRYREASGPDAA